MGKLPDTPGRTITSCQGFALLHTLARSRNACYLADPDICIHQHPEGGLDYWLQRAALGSRWLPSSSKAILGIALPGPQQGQNSKIFKMPVHYTPPSLSSPSCFLSAWPHSASPRRYCMETCVSRVSTQFLCRETTLDLDGSVPFRQLCLILEIDRSGCGQYEGRGLCFPATGWSMGSDPELDHAKTTRSAFAPETNLQVNHSIRGASDNSNSPSLASRVVSLLSGGAIKS